ncbi:MAG: hypothetical protein ACI92E_003091, partial [Oceanicoccus sp.]
RNIDFDEKFSKLLLLVLPFLGTIMPDSTRIYL